MHIISDDLTHDQESVHVFHTAVWKELNKMGVRQERWHWWSDGGPAHFKNSAAYADLTRYAIEFDGLVLNRAFGASSHMKGEWDGSGTFVKSSVDSYLMTTKCKLINTAFKYYEWCRDNLSEVRSHQSIEFKSRAEKVTLHERRFLFVAATDVARVTGKRREKVDSVHAVHQIFVGRPPQHPLMARSLACFCVTCRHREWHGASSQSTPPPGVCENAAWCLPPSPLPIKMRPAPRTGGTVPAGSILTTHFEDDDDDDDYVPSDSEEEEEDQEVEADAWERYVQEKKIELDLVGWTGEHYEEYEQPPTSGDVNYAAWKR